MFCILYFVCFQDLIDSPWSQRPWFWGCTPRRRARWRRCWGASVPYHRQLELSDTVATHTHHPQPQSNYRVSSTIRLKARASRSEQQCRYLHHEDHSVERDHDQDGVLERWRHDEVPQSVLERLAVLGHVARKRLSTDSKVDAGSLNQTWDAKAEQVRFISKQFCCNHSLKMELIIKKLNKITQQHISFCLLVALPT